MAFRAQPPADDAAPPPAPQHDSQLLDLRILQLDRRRPAEDRDGHLEPGALLVDFLDQPVERGERPVRHPDLLADLEGDRRLRTLYALLHLPDDPIGLGLADRRRLAAPAEEPGDLGSILN